MAWSVNVIGQRTHLLSRAKQRFAADYPDAPQADRASFAQAETVLEKFVKASEDDGQFVLSMSGHGQEEEGEGRAALAVSIYPA